MAFFSGRNSIFNSNSERLRRSKRLGNLGKEQLQHWVKELSDDLQQGEALLQSLPIGIILLNRDFHLQLMNRAVQRCPLFFARQGTSQQNNSPIWHALDHDELAHWLATELQGNGVIQPREFQFFDSNNELRVTRVEISSQVRNGTIEGWIILISDVSELRRQERRVQQLDILASLSTVTAGVAHEIKNPLAAMSLHIQLMQRLLKKSNPEADGAFLHEQLIEYCGIVQEEIERLNIFVTDFLLTVRPLELELVKQNIHKVLLACLELLQPELINKGISLDLQLAKELPDVALDESMFKRLLLNLMQNSLLAIEEKAESLQSQLCEIYQGKLTLNSYLKNDKVYLEIQDNGCGMNKETQKKIFEPFFTTRAKGSGLGMTMVLRILQNHNGDLQIQSEEGCGTMLRIALPVFYQEQRLLLERSTLL